MFGVWNASSMFFHLIMRGRVLGAEHTPEAAGVTGEIRQVPHLRNEAPTSPWDTCSRGLGQGHGPGHGRSQCSSGTVTLCCDCAWKSACRDAQEPGLGNMPISPWRGSPSRTSGQQPKLTSPLPEGLSPSRPRKQNSQARLHPTFIGAPALTPRVFRSPRRVVLKDRKGCPGRC